MEKAIVIMVQAALMDAGYDIGSARPDGRLGPATLRSLKSEGVFDAIAEGVANADIPLSSSPAKVKNSENLISATELKALAGEAASWFLTVSDRRAKAFNRAVMDSGLTLSGYLVFIVNLEAAKVGSLYDASSVSPSGLHVGLTQIGQPAWADASSFSEDIPRVKKGDSASLFANATQPLLSLKVALLVAAANWSYTSTKVARGQISKRPFSYEYAYSMHNLGHTVAYDIEKGKVEGNRYFSGQSANAKIMLLSLNGSPEIRQARG